MTDNNLTPTGDEFTKKVLAIVGGQSVASRREQKRNTKALARIQRSAELRAATERAHLTQELARMVGRTILTSKAADEVITLTAEAEDQIKQVSPMAAARVNAVLNAATAAAQLQIMRY